MPADGLDDAGGDHPVVEGIGAAMGQSFECRCVGGIDKMPACRKGRAAGVEEVGARGRFGIQPARVAGNRRRKARRHFKAGLREFDCRVQQ